MREAIREADRDLHPTAPDQRVRPDGAQMQACTVVSGQRLLTTPGTAFRAPQTTKKVSFAPRLGRSPPA